MIDPRLRGRVAVVTGGDSALGIGAAIARGLARQDVRLLLVRSPAGEDHVAAALRADGVVVHSVAVDLAEPGAAVRIFDAAEEHVGEVQILVNNAAHRVADTFGSSSRRGVVGWDGAGLDAHYAVNTRAPALLIAELQRRHVRRGDQWGRIISVSTDAADGAAGEVSLQASKSALESLTRSAAVELGPVGITANIIAAGPVRTGWLDRDSQRRLAGLSPLGRVAHPEDVADVAVFLASHQARWLTGQTLFATGGKRMC